MPYVGFKPMIQASKWAKTVHALDRSATVTGIGDNPVLFLSTPGDHNLFL
jgi:hypothetical protein